MQVDEVELVGGRLVDSEDRIKNNTVSNISICWQLKELRDEQVDIDLVVLLVVNAIVSNLGLGQ